MGNLISCPFGGAVFPVSPEYTITLGIKAYRRVTAVPDQVDLEAAASPAATVPGIMAECAPKNLDSAATIRAMRDS